MATNDLAVMINHYFRKLYLRTGSLWLAIYSLVALSFVCIIMFYSSDEDYTQSSVPKMPSQHCTVVINTFERNEMMEKAVDYYAKCPSVKNIHVVWSEQTPVPEKYLKKYSKVDYPKVSFLLLSFLLLTFICDLDFVRSTFQH